MAMLGPVAWADIFPFMGISIRCSDRTLSAMTPDDVEPLLAAADTGVVDASRPYPFLTDWALLPREERMRSSASFYFSTWASVRPDRWTLLMVMREGDTVIGAQDLMASDFALLRVAKTGSWLARSAQGRGLGTLMRQMICTLAFDHLGAVELRTEAFADNPPSNRVSEKLGYERVETARAERLGELAHAVRYRLTADTFIRPDVPIEVTGVQAFRQFIGA